MPSDAPMKLNRLSQSLWLDNITRDLLDSGTLQRYIDTLSVTGLTSNPTIFDHAISRSDTYDAEIHRQLDKGLSGEALFFHLAVQDLTRAADLFAPVYARTATVDGFVSLEVSPLLAYDSSATVKQAKALHAQANRPNLFIKIPGTREGLAATEVVRWRLVDLVQWIRDEFAVSISTQTLSRELRAMGYRKLTARPRHHAQDADAIPAFKKTSQPRWQRSGRRSPVAHP